MRQVVRIVVFALATTLGCQGDRVEPGPEQATIGTRRQALCTVPDSLIPVFRFDRFSPHHYDFLTLDPTEAALPPLNNPTPLSSQNTVDFYTTPKVAGSCPAGTSPLFRLVNTFTGLVWYTTSATDRDSLLAGDPNYKFMGDLGCINSDEGGACDRVPLYRIIFGSDVVFTANFADKVTIGGTADILGYVWKYQREQPGAPYVVRQYGSTYVPIDDDARSGTASQRISLQVDGDDEATEITPPVLAGEPPFAFRFYGRTYGTVRVSTNGLLLFGPPTSADNAFFNVALGSPGAPRNAIAAWWDDFKMLSNLRYQYVTKGSAPDREFIVQWGDDNGDWVNRNDQTLARSMQVHLFEASGRIEVHYGPSSTGAMTMESATQGIADPWGTGTYPGIALGCSPACNQSSWQTNSVMAYMPEPPGYMVHEAHFPYPVDGMDDKMDFAGYHTIKDQAGTVAVPLGAGNKSAWVPIGFSFLFDGARYTQVGASMRGALTFDHLLDGAGMVGPGNVAIPVPVGADSRLLNMIAPWFDDNLLINNPGDDFLYLTRPWAGHPGLKEFIVEWRSLRNGDFMCGDPCRVRNMQVHLFEGTNEILIHYGHTSLEKDKGLTTMEDTATAGIQAGQLSSSAGTFRLLMCSPNCGEGDRPVDKSKAGYYTPRLGGTLDVGDWHSYTTFTFTPDAGPEPSWSTLYRSYFGPGSLGHCEDCHADLVKNREDYFDALQAPIRHPETDGASTAYCAYKYPEVLLSWAFLNRSWNMILPNSVLLAPGNGAQMQPIMWMSEPAGGEYGADVNMPWDDHCNTTNGNTTQLVDDVAKTLIKRWAFRPLR